MLKTFLFFSLVSRVTMISGPTVAGVENDD